MSLRKSDENEKKEMQLYADISYDRSAARRQGSIYIGFGRGTMKVR
jgi:hypothetical protein